MQLFLRQGYQEIWFRIQSNEVLGILDSDYVEDYYGVDGQLTLYNPSTDSRTAILVNEVPSITPSIPHDVFEGYLDLTTLNDGVYRLEGRVKDVLDHYTVLSEVQSSFGTELVIPFEIKISSHQIAISAPFIVPLVEGVTVLSGLSITKEVSPTMRTEQTTSSKIPAIEASPDLRISQQVSSKLPLVVMQSASIVKYKQFVSGMKKGVLISALLSKSVT